MNTKRFVSVLLLGAVLAGCTDLVQTNPNEQTTDTFWQTREDAVAGINAAYNVTHFTGSYSRWLTFAHDLRSDIGLSRSPWTDLSNFMKFTFTSYDFEVNADIWRHQYIGIFRANQVIANVPNIEMDAAVRDRIVGEAKFLRALYYFNLVTLYGNVPLVLEPSDPAQRPPTVPPAETWAQIEQDLTEAIAVLPESYDDAEKGRATRWAAIALLAKAHMQQRAWSDAEPLLRSIVQSNDFMLMPSYAELFDDQNENDAESIFEVQYTDDSRLSTGAHGNNIPRMIGPCNVGFCDGQPTQWYFDQFFQEPTEPLNMDPRLEYTIFWNKPGGMDVFGTPFAVRYGAESDDLYWKKYSEYWRTDQQWDSRINVRVIRYADVLLLLAEALNEQGGNLGEALGLVNDVRDRVDLPPAAAANQEALRSVIEHERLMELGLEGGRWLYLQRQNMLTAQHLPELREHDPEFAFFEVGKSELLPVPQSEVDLNPEATQNPGWR